MIGVELHQLVLGARQYTVRRCEDQVPSNRDPRTRVAARSDDWNDVTRDCGIGWQRLWRRCNAPASGTANNYSAGGKRIDAVQQLQMNC